MKQAQISTISFQTRHDYLFEDLRDLMKDKSITNPRILSFGCSEGFEPFDIKRIIPQAMVFGCDINQRALAKAEALCGPHGIGIFSSDADAIRGNGPYDAIVCLNVLVRYPDIAGKEDISEIYPFADFDEAVSVLGTSLTVGGVFVLYNSCYLMEQTAQGEHFAAVPVRRHLRNGWV